MDLYHLYPWDLVVAKHKNIKVCKILSFADFFLKYCLVIPNSELLYHIRHFP
jgi:hypothetical protein